MQTKLLSLLIEANKELTKIVANDKGAFTEENNEIGLGIDNAIHALLMKQAEQRYNEISNFVISL